MLVICNLNNRVQYNGRPSAFFDQVMLLTDRCSDWSAICTDQFSCIHNSLLLAFITCIIIVIIIVVLSPFIINAIQFLLKYSLHQSINSMCMCKVNIAPCVYPIINCGLQLTLQRNDHYNDYMSSASQEKKRK